MDPPSSSTVASRLFPGFRSRSTASRTTATRKRTNGGNWTAHFFCLSAKDQERTPTCTEKEILYRTGLGLKKIKVNNSLNEEEVIQLLQSEQGFLKVKDCGGFELLRTLQNGRHLVPVPSPWTSKALKMNVGPQARIYIRPIQHSLSVEPVLCDEGPTVNVACAKCKVGFSVHELRHHILFCGLTQSSVDTINDRVEHSNIADSNIDRLNQSSVADSNIDTLNHSSVANSNIDRLNQSSVADANIDTLNQSSVADSNIHRLSQSSVADANISRLNQSSVADANIHRLNQSSVADANVDRLNQSSVADANIDRLNQSSVADSDMDGLTGSSIADSDITTQYYQYILIQNPNEVETRQSTDRNTDEISFRNEHDRVTTFDNLSDLETSQSLNDTVQYCITFCRQNDISNPVEMLRKIQEQIVTGRPLEVEDSDTSIDGETTFITVNRDNLLNTSMEEISSFTPEELRKTLEVQFYNELASDYGGPRKEFFRLVQMEIKDKYFDKGIRDLLATDYRTVGIILALSILQNGKMPVFLSPELVEEIFGTVEPRSPAVKNLREGLNVLGLYDLFLGLPELRFLLQPSVSTITMKRITTMLRPTFSEDGSNASVYEKEVYSLFIKYLREVAAGRRGHLTLSSILTFVTGADEEPLLGFKLQPSTVFCQVNDGFLPTSSTCTNSLTLPRPTQTNQLPKPEEVFQLYDYAFSNAFYGVV